MSRLCLFIIFLGIIVRFGDCENNNKNCTPSAPGSDETRVSGLEKIARHFGFLNHFQKENKKIYDSSFKETIIKSVRNKKENKKLLEFKNYGVIFPGTHWCGDGDNAKNKNDLGYFNGTDACCRAHDNCKNDISAGDTEVNLKNNGIFTRSACICDNAFYDCLKNVSSLLSKGIGDTYFNILRPQCFECICPTDNCNPGDNTDCKGQCAKYEWKNNPKF